MFQQLRGEGPLLLACCSPVPALAKPLLQPSPCAFSSLTSGGLCFEGSQQHTLWVEHWHPHTDAFLEEYLDRPHSTADSACAFYLLHGKGMNQIAPGQFAAYIHTCIPT